MMVMMMVVFYAGLGCQSSLSLSLVGGIIETLSDEVVTCKQISPLLAFQQGWAYIYVIICLYAERFQSRYFMPVCMYAMMLADVFNLWDLHRCLTWLWRSRRSGGCIAWGRLGPSRYEEVIFRALGGPPVPQHCAEFTPNRQTFHRRLLSDLILITRLLAALPTPGTVFALGRNYCLFPHHTRCLLLPVAEFVSCSRATM